MKVIIRILISLCIGQCSAILSAQMNNHLDNSITQLDPGIRYGRLENGFSYYIKPLSKDRSELSMRLLVKAGQFQEDPDQWQLAHFVEHMPFVRTANFSTIHRNTKVLEPLGMKSGDVFALTGGNFTTFWFNCPPQNKMAIRTGLLWYHDIINNMEFRTEDVDGERGAFFQEYLFRNGRSYYFDRKISQGISDCYSSPVYPDNYAHYIQTFDKEKLIRFHRDWYRPDLSALVVVGNIMDIDELEKQIRDRFSDIIVSTETRHRVDCHKEYLDRPNQFMVLEDSLNLSKGYENKIVPIHLFIRDYGTIDAKLDKNKSAVAMTILNKFINKKIKQAESAYSSFSHVQSQYDHNGEFPAIEIKLGSEEEKVKESIEFISSILRNIKILGINEMEWHDIIKEEEQKSKSGQDGAKYWIDQIRNHFIFEKPLRENENLILYNWLKDLSLADINGIFSGIIPDQPQDIVVIAPKESENLGLSEIKVRNWITGINKKPVLEISREKEITSLMNEAELSNLIPVPYTQQEYSIHGADEILLDNGIKVILQNGDFNGNILVHGFSPGGTSSLSRENYYSAINAPSIIQNSGVGEIDKFKLRGYLRKTSIPLTVIPYIDFAESGIKGEASPKDLEDLMQLIYLNFTEPRKDSLAFVDWQNAQKNMYRKEPRGNLINSDIQNEFMNKLSNDSTIFQSRVGTKHFESIQHVNMEQAYNVYSEIFGNARNFTFLITGNYEKKEALPLVRKYLGNLPNLQNSNKNINPNTEKIKIHKILVNRIASLGQQLENTKIRIKYVYPVDIKFDWKEEIKLEFLTGAIYAKLDELRFVLKRDVFSTIAHQWHFKSVGWNVISIGLDCSIEDADIVREDIKEIIYELKNNKLDDNTFYFMTETFFNKYNSTNVKNSAKRMQDKLYQNIRFGEPLVDPEIVEQYLKSLTPQDILDTAQKYLKDKYYSEFIINGSDMLN